MDLDANGTKDMVSGSWPGELYLFTRKANGVYAKPEKLKHASGGIIKVGSASAVAAADWDGDGDIDLVVGNIEGALFQITNEGTAEKPAFGPAERLMAGRSPVVAAGGDSGPCLADWDSDGKLDLIVGSGSGTVTWHRNIGTKTKPELGPPATLVRATERQKLQAEFQNPTAPGTRTKVDVADWNGDGKPDLLVGDFSSGGARQYHGWVWVYLRKSAPLTAEASK